VNIKATTLLTVLILATFSFVIIVNKVPDETKDLKYNLAFAFTLVLGVLFLGYIFAGFLCDKEGGN
jgi:hypothetical protein